MKPYANDMEARSQADGLGRMMSEHVKKFGPSEEGFHIYLFSDCIAVFCRPSNMSRLLEMLRSLQIKSGTKGFLWRGFISCGDFNWIGDSFVSPAFVKAATLESNVVKFPRIVVGHEVIEEIEAPLDYYLNEDPSDGYMYIDYFTNFGGKYEELAHRDYLHRLRSAVHSRYEIVGDNEAVKQIYRWFFMRFDENIDKYEYYDMIIQ